MNSLPPSLHRAVQRARWLAELATALDHAAKLTLELCEHIAGDGQAIVVREQILASRAEIDLLQRGRHPMAENPHPDWMR